MSLASPPGCACPTPVTTDVPGSPGAPGDNGTNGINAFSITQAPFVVPAISSSVSVTVNQNAWFVVGQNVYVQGAGYFSVNSVAGTNVVGLTYLNYTGNTNAGNTIGSGAQISPAGTQVNLTLPLSIANGGTNAADVGDAQTNLGLGQNGTFANVNGLTQAVTATPTLIAGVTFSVPATGLYLVMAFATVDMQGDTFASNEVITLAVVDTTASTTIATAAKNTGTPTTTKYPSIDYLTPFLTATLTSGDVLQLQISIAVTPSAGTIQVSSASLIILPLAL